MNDFKKIAVPLGVLMVCVVLIAGLWRQLIDYIILPIATLFWQIWRILTGVDQAAYWVIVLLACLFMVIRLLPVRRETPPRPSYQISPKPPDRVAYWAILFAEAEQGKNGNEYLRSDLAELCMSLILQLERSDRTDTRKILEEEQSSLPPEMHQYLFPVDENNDIFSTNGKTDFAAFVPRWLRSMNRKINASNGREVDDILDWMENELEINHHG